MVGGWAAREFYNDKTMDLVPVRRFRPSLLFELRLGNISWPETGF